MTMVIINLLLSCALSVLAIGISARKGGACVSFVRFPEDARDLWRHDEVLEAGLDLPAMWLVLHFKTAFK